MVETFGQRRCHRVERSARAPLDFPPRASLRAERVELQITFRACLLVITSSCQTTKMKWMWMRPPRCNSRQTMPVGRRERRPTSPSQPWTICHGMPSHLISKQVEADYLDRVEKYRPSSLDDVSGHQDILATINRFIEANVFSCNSSTKLRP